MFLLSWLNLWKYQLQKWTCSWSGQFTTNGWKIGRKAIGSKDASVKWICGNTLDYKADLKHCTSCLKMLRTELLNTLCWIVTKIVVKCRHKRNKHVHTFQTLFFLNFLRREGSPLPDVWLFFKIVFKQQYSWKWWFYTSIPWKVLRESNDGVL